MTRRNALVKVSSCGAAICLGGAVVATEGAISLPSSQRQWVIDPGAEEVHITGADGAVMRGACFHPKGEPRGAVLILHGVGDHGSSGTTSVVGLTGSPRDSAQGTFMVMGRRLGEEF